MSSSVVSLEAHAASFLPLFKYETIHILRIVLAAKPAFTRKPSRSFFPPDFADDFPVAMQISHKYSLICDHQAWTSVCV
ncbi:hypothetical protein HHK36_032781 [Tetracentron sinense]|uniref:Uncharacterized protein n=1 Tax=Tetracentron sinense TaxID=13715 RepID=A0A835D042_TETSI|nr:hypothetical protein HHK36_032781 [Tetracentron sinense]